VGYFKELFKKEAISSELEIPASHLNIIKFPIEGHLQLIRVPTERKIHATLKEMGPDRAPGPDDLTTRFILKEWNILGPGITTRIQNTFRTHKLPDQWMLSHLVLILKTEQPSKPAHFRPLSVCSIFYRLLMKIITNRIKPFFALTNLTNTRSIPKRVEHPRKCTPDERSATLLSVPGIQ
jgi:hypothetical protein